MAKRLPAPKSIMITGASSGIGEQLALAYAAGGVSLFLTGRDRARLDAVSRSCESKGALTRTATVDAADRDAMRDLVARWEREAALDLVIANAGISGGANQGTPFDVVGEETLRDIFAVNLAGVINTVLPAIGPMCNRGRGQIAIMSSLAGFRGMPTAPSYCASKAAVRSWGEGLRGRLAPHGVAVNVVCPGFVVSRMTDANTFKMPMLMETERAARIIVKELARNQARIAFPWPMYLAAWLVNALPASWSDVLLNRLPDKG